MLYMCLHVVFGGGVDATVRISQAGRVVIPADVRAHLRLRPGTRMLLRVEGSAIHLTPIDEAIDRLQERAAKLLGSSGSMSEELISERRLAASAEEGGHRPVDAVRF